MALLAFHNALGLVITNQYNYDYIYRYSLSENGNALAIITDTTGVFSSRELKVYQGNTAYIVSSQASIVRSPPLKWADVCMSADGQKLVAVSSRTTNVFNRNEIFEGELKLSADGGQTWQTSTSAGLRDWISVTCSADGLKIAALWHDINSWGLQLSNDGGQTWQASTSTQRLNELVSSNDGQKLASLCPAGGGFPASLQLSDNGGLTWQQISTGATGEWHGLRASSDLTTMTAITATGQLMLSADGGHTWTAQTAVSFSGWFSTVISEDGKVIIALLA